MTPIQQPPASTPPETRKQKIRKGVVGAEMIEIERNVPADEPPPLPPNARLKQIGKRIPRVDGKYKVSGLAKYPSDVQLPGMLYARLVCSTMPHARVASIDTSAAEKHPGVRAVHVLDSVLGGAQLQDKSKEIKSDYPIVRYSGQPVAAVAAVSQNAADEAAGLIKVEYEALPFVVDELKARDADSPLVFPGDAGSRGSAGGGGGASGVAQHGNVRGPSMGRSRGDAAKAMAASEVTVEGEFHTQVQTHSALETHGIVADWREDGLTVYASTQGTLSVREELAEFFKLPRNKVRVITEYMGGGFGAKFGAGTYGVVATNLSKKAGAPVRLFHDRREEHWMGHNRPSSHQQVKLGAKKDGTLQAIHLVGYGTAGVATGAGCAGPAQNLYQCGDVSTAEYDVFINAAPGTAFRAPGHPQGCFALEQAMDDLAEKLGMDPVELREKNDPLQTRREERRIGVEKFGWKQKHRPPNSDPGPIKRGVGFAQGVWYRFIDMDSNAEVRISKDGSVELLSAVQDIGGGIKTVLAQVVAEELGLEVRDVTIRVGDTNFPVGPESGGSVTTGSITPAARNAAYKVKQKLFKDVAAVWNAPLEDMRLENGKVVAGSRSMTFRQALTRMGVEQISATAERKPEYGAREQVQLGGAQFAEVTVDTETGVIKVEHVLAVHDCGRPMNPLQLESQVNGGVLQGISFALFEDRKLDRNTGIMVNPNLEQYKIVGSMDTPHIEAFFIEDILARSSTDAGGIGEPATIPTAAAIANAVYNATGVRLRRIPMTPARVLEALGKVPAAATSAGGAL